MFGVCLRVQARQSRRTGAQGGRWRRRRAAVPAPRPGVRDAHKPVGSQPWPVLLQVPAPQRG